MDFYGSLAGSGTSRDTRFVGIYFKPLITLRGLADFSLLFCIILYLIGLIVAADLKADGINNFTARIR